MVVYHTHHSNSDGGNKEQMIWWKSRVFVYYKQKDRKAIVGVVKGRQLYNWELQWHYKSVEATPPAMVTLDLSQCRK